MAITNTESRWGWLSKALHWTIAVLMIAAIVCSVWADQLDPEIEWHRSLWQWLIMRLHKPLGFLALVLIVFRVGWALVSRRPQLPDSMSRGEVWLSKITHLALYALMLLVPLSG